MFNDYIIIGPKEDLAEVSNSLSSSEVFTKIYNSGSRFISGQTLAVLMLLKCQFGLNLD